MKIDVDEVLTKVYYDPKTGFVSAKNLKKILPDIPIKDIDAFLKRQEVSQLHKPKGKTEFYPISGPVGTYQADLTFYEQYKHQNKGFYIILTVIEVNSRRAYARALKNKTAETIIEAFGEVMDEAQGYQPMTVVGTDRGSEFNKKFTSFLDDNAVNHYQSDTGDKNKMSMVERFNRTIRDKIERYLTSRNTNKWFDVLADIVENYNNTEHGTTGFAPNKVGEKELRSIREQQEDRVRKVDRKVEKLEVGQKVRRLRKKTIFEKKTGSNYYHGVYTIVEVNPYSYELKNENGEILKETVKHYEVVPIGEVQTFSKKEEETDRKAEIKVVKKEKEWKKEGVDRANIIEGKRRR
jgi:hypothetical protein